MTVRGKHLQCDMRDTCVSCSIYTWPPKVNSPKKYFHCKLCNRDILCDRGLSAIYKHYDDGVTEKKAKCIKCDNILIEIIWPKIPVKLERELLKLE